MSGPELAKADCAKHLFTVPFIKIILHNFLSEGSCVDLHPGVGSEPAGPHRHHQGHSDLLPGQGPLVRAQLSRCSAGQEIMHKKEKSNE